MNDREEQRRKCEGCNFHFVISKLFTVRDKRLCGSCGKVAIQEWNQHVREAELVLKRGTS